MSLFQPIRAVAGATLAALLLAPAPSPAGGPTPLPVFELIDARLGQMESVALFKAQNGLPVEDRARESLVLEKAQESARAAGLDPRSVEAFYRAQIQAAKAIQYRYMADWALRPEIAERPAQDLETELRPRLLAIGRELTEALRAFLEAGGCFRDAQLPLFLERIRAEHLSEAEKVELFRSMSRIDLVEPVAGCGVGASEPLLHEAPDSGSKRHPASPAER